MTNISDARVRAALARGGYRVGVEVTLRRSTRSTPSDDIGWLPRIEIFADDDIESFARKLRHGAAAPAAPNIEASSTP
jgi:hypothetical protein